MDINEDDTSDFEDVEVVQLEEDEDIELDVDFSKLTFDKHQNSVFVGCFNLEGTLAVTGGQDDVAYVWKVETGEVVLECTGHKDSVTQVSFSIDGKFVATGDMGGIIQVWCLEERKLIYCYEGDELEWMIWHKNAPILFAGGKSGDIYMWQIPSGNCKVIPSIGASSTSAILLPDGKQLISSYGNGQIRLWDLKTTNLIWQCISEGVELLISITEINSDIFHTIPHSNLMKISDGKTVCQLDKNPIECAAYSQEFNLLATGSLEGKVCIWDVPKQTTRHEMQLAQAITNIKWGPNLNLFVASVDACVYVFDGRQGNLVRTITGHTDAILNMCISYDGTNLLTTSDDHTAKLFQLV